VSKKKQLLRINNNVTYLPSLKPTAKAPDKKLLPPKGSRTISHPTINFQSILLLVAGRVSGEAKLVCFMTLCFEVKKVPQSRIKQHPCHHGFNNKKQCHWDVLLSLTRESKYLNAL